MTARDSKAKHDSPVKDTDALSPDSIKVWRELARLEYIQGNSVGAISMAEKGLSLLDDASKSSPEHWPLYYYLIDAMLEQGELDAAGEKLVEFEQYVPQSHLDLIYLKTHFAFRKKWWQEVYEFGTRYIRRYPLVRKNQEVRRKLFVQSINRKNYVLWMRCVAAVVQEDMEKTRTAFKLMANDPDFKPETALDLLEHAQLTSTEFVSRLMRLVWQVAPGAQFILDSLKLFPYDTLTVRTRHYLKNHILPAIVSEHTFAAGRLLMQMEYFQDAARVLAQVQDSDHDEQVQFLLAQALLEIGEFEKTIKVLERMMHRYPDNRDARLLYEALVPKTGRVESSAPVTEDETEALLMEVIEYCRSLLLKKKPEQVPGLLAQVFGVLAPTVEHNHEEFFDLQKGISLISGHAIANNYLRLVKVLDNMKEFIHEHYHEWA